MQTRRHFLTTQQAPVVGSEKPTPLALHGGGQLRPGQCLWRTPSSSQRGETESLPPPPSARSCVPAARWAVQAAGHGSSWRSRSWSSTRCRRAGPAGSGHSWPAPAGRHSPCWGPGAGRPVLRETSGERVVGKLRVAGNSPALSFP